MHCLKCNAEVKENDRFCASCGEKIKPTKVNIDEERLPKKGNSFLVNFIVIILGIWGISKCSEQVDTVDTMSSEASSATSDYINTWHYRNEVSAMTGKPVKTALIQSANEVKFKFPYNEPQRMFLGIRKEKQTDIILMIEHGQFVCTSFDGCDVLVRFDESSPNRFKASPPADHSTTKLYIDNPSRFLKKLEKAKKVRIQAIFYQEGSVVFEFDADGFSMNKLR